MLTDEPGIASTPRLARTWVSSTALERVFQRYAVDPSHLAIGGFSDGASYALSLGLTNGDLFNHVIAFSPGFLAPGERIARPRIFISHGTNDRVLPVACSQRIVAVLRDSGYDVTYREFAGPHIVPVGIAHQAVEWFLGKEGAMRLT